MIWSLVRRLGVFITILTDGKVPYWNIQWIIFSCRLSVHPALFSWSLESLPPALHPHRDRQPGRLTGQRHGGQSVWKKQVWSEQTHQLFLYLQKMLSSSVHHQSIQSPLCVSSCPQGDIYVPLSIIQHISQPPGTTRSFILIGRNFSQWHCSTEQGTSYVHSVVFGYTHLQNDLMDSTWVRRINAFQGAHCTVFYVVISRIYNQCFNTLSSTTPLINKCQYNQ